MKQWDACSLHLTMPAYPVNFKTEATYQQYNQAYVNNKEVLYYCTLLLLENVS